MVELFAGFWTQQKTMKIGRIFPTTILIKLRTGPSKTYLLEKQVPAHLQFSILTPGEAIEKIDFSSLRSQQVMTALRA